MVFSAVDRDACYLHDYGVKNRTNMYKLIKCPTIKAVGGAVRLYSMVILLTTLAMELFKCVS